MNVKQESREKSSGGQAPDAHAGIMIPRRRTLQPVDHEAEVRLVKVVPLPMDLVVSLSLSAPPPHRINRDPLVRTPTQRTPTDRFFR